MKLCTKCSVLKSAESFSKNRIAPDGLVTQCKSCRADYQRMWNTKNRKYRARKKRLLYRKNPVPDLAASRRWRKKNPNHWKKTYYGVSVEDYNRMVSEQNGLCAICAAPETEISHRSGRLRALSIDHDHRTDSIRGLLCSKCNRAMGMLKDSEKILGLMIDYLLKHLGQRQVGKIIQMGRADA